jgi:threonylcarbamoyladenosine tRNA methylthiotransferase MtaB
MNIAIKTLGCKSNRYESDKLFEKLSGKFNVVEVNDGATTFGRESSKDYLDVIIINTCAVTSAADKKSRQAIFSFKRKYPDAKIIVFGCSSNVAPEKYKEMRDVDFVGKNVLEVSRIVKKLTAKRESDRAPCEGGERTRALIKIQDGCNHFCTYCIVPRARGPEVSYSLKSLITEAQNLEKTGYKEIVITGINIGRWKENGKDIGHLISTLIKSTKNIRFRISSIEPKNFSKEFFDLFKNPRLCNHIHMSLQSGSDGVLKRMRRDYTAAEFAKICEKLRKVSPDIGLTTDVIVGFPGETEKEFSDTCKFVQKIGFLKIHVFPFSKRENTAAYYMKNQIPEQEKKSRAKILQKIADKMGAAFKKSAIGQTHEVLVHKRKKGDYFIGYTSNYVPIKFKYNEPATPPFNQIIKIRLKKLDKDGVVLSEPTP